MSPKDRIDRYGTISLFVFLVVLAWVGNAVLMYALFGKPDSAGEAGDMFGSVNALFSGAAFVILIAALVLQTKELSLQRTELSLVRKEYEKMVVNQSRQLDVMREQYNLELIEKDVIPELQYSKSSNYPVDPDNPNVNRMNKWEYKNVSRAHCMLYEIVLGTDEKEMIDLDLTASCEDYPIVRHHRAINRDKVIVLLPGEELSIEMPDIMAKEQRIAEIYFRFCSPTGKYCAQLHRVSGEGASRKLTGTSWRG